MENCMKHEIKIMNATQLEQANSDVENLGKRVAEVEKKAKKKDDIKNTINKKIEEVLKKEEEIIVDKEE